MQLADVMDTLRTKGKPGTAKIYKRHGIADECYGVSYSDLGALIRKLKVNHELALALWDTGVHDARVLATKIVDPARMTRARIEGWLKEANDHIIAAAVAGVAARMSGGLVMARAWIKSAGDLTSAGGWGALTDLANAGRIEDAVARELIELIRTRIHRAKNRTRYSMNNTLIALGGHMESVRELALQAAREIGPVEVDHGETGCKTPDAQSYIARMAERARATKAPARAAKAPARAAKAPARAATPAKRPKKR